MRAADPACLCLCLASGPLSGCGGPARCRRRTASTACRGHRADRAGGRSDRAARARARPTPTPPQLAEFVELMTAEAPSRATVKERDRAVLTAGASAPAPRDPDRARQRRAGLDVARSTWRRPSHRRHGSECSLADCVRGAIDGRQRARLASPSTRRVEYDVHNLDVEARPTETVAAVRTRVRRQTPGRTDRRRAAGRGHVRVLATPAGRSAGRCASSAAPEAFGDRVRRRVPPGEPGGIHAARTRRRRSSHAPSNPADLRRATQVFDT